MMKNRTEEHQLQGRTQRLPWLDAARLAAIAFVIVNHSLSSLYGNQFPTGTAPASIMTTTETIFRALMFTISRYGVPLFLMITGALLLPRDYETPTVTRRLYRHNIVRLLVATELWLAIYFIGILLTGQGQRARLLGTSGSGITALINLTLHGVLNQLFISPVTLGNMWYMQMIIPVYMMLPLVATALKRLPLKYLAAPAAVVFAYFCVLPTIQVILAASGSHILITPAFHASYLFTYYIIFIALGYLIAHRHILKPLPTRTLIATLTALTLLSAAYLTWLYHTTIDYQYGYEFPLLYLAAPALFELLRRSRATNRPRPLVTWTATAAFALYMLHRPLLIILERYLGFRPGTTGITGFIVLFLASATLSSLLIIPLSRIKPLRRWLLLMK